VCDLVGVQAHVLRYWETEFPMLAPQKNRAGQRTYRRRDVEIALRIKELLYEDLYTIAGAKKKLSVELREATRLKVVPNTPSVEAEPQAKPIVIEEKPQPAPQKFEPKPQVQQFVPRQQLVNNFPKPDFHDEETDSPEFAAPAIGGHQRDALHALTKQLSELMQLLETAEETPRRKW